MEEVKKHRTPEDGWTVISGTVYNLTPYLRFHPGGAKILHSVLGKDGTKMFIKYHAWVNAPALLERCIVGMIERPK
jgi:cytochrome b involved in lipid metabolism